MTGSLSHTRGRPEPGRELDALIAEKVMGLKLPTVEEMWAEAARVWKDQPSCSVFMMGFEVIEDEAGGQVLQYTLPRYSTNIFAAFAVVEKITQEEDGREVEFMVRYSPYNRGWFAQIHSITRKMFATASADSASHAICLAALAALSPADDGGAR